MVHGRCWPIMLKSTCFLLANDRVRIDCYGDMGCLGLLLPSCGKAARKPRPNDLTIPLIGHYFRARTFPAIRVHYGSRACSGQARSEHRGLATTVLEPLGDAGQPTDLVPLGVGAPGHTGMRRLEVFPQICAPLYSKRGATKCDDFRDLSRAPAAPPASGPKPIKTALRCGAPPVRCP